MWALDVSVVGYRMGGIERNSLYGVRILPTACSSLISLVVYMVISYVIGAILAHYDVVLF